MSAINETLEHEHLSGRFTASPAEEEAAIEEAVKRAHFLTTSEIDANVRARCLHQPGFAAVYGDKGGRDDCGIAVRTSRLKLIDGFTKVVSPLTYPTQSFGQSSPTAAAFAVVHDLVWDSIGVLAAVHTPHGMQNELRTGHITSPVGRAYRGIVNGTQDEVDLLTKAHKADWSEITGDMNVDLRNLWVQLYLRRTFRGRRVNFQKPYPRKGTFQGEIIDLGFLAGNIKVVHGPTIGAPLKGFDHIRWHESLAPKRRLAA